MHAVERELTRRLERPVQLRRAGVPADPACFIGGEAAQFRALTNERRRQDWLLGRLALKALLPAATDTSHITFPHPQLSITHAGGVAYAVQVTGVLGTGVDFEPAVRRPSARAARFYLRPAEIPDDHSPEHLLRLWTVKESLFKATPDNSRVVLSGFRLEQPTSSDGWAAGPHGEQLRYLSVAVPDGVLTVAICLAEGARDVAV